MDFSQHFKHNKQRLISSALLTIIVICLNLLSLNHFFRLDLTKENRFTLSRTSQNLASEVNDLVQIKFFVSSKLPPNLELSSQYVKDILSEYEALSNGNLKVSIQDPASDTQIAEEAAILGVPQIQMEILQKDQYQVQNGYFGLAILYAGVSETIPVLDDLTSLEYDITSRLKKLSKANMPKIAFVSDVGGYDSENGYSIIAAQLGQNYEIKNINLNDNNNIDVDTIILGGPRDEISDLALYKLDQFVLKGGKLIVLADTLDVENGLQVTEVNQNKLNDWLKSFDISLNTDLIYDQYHENTSFSQGFISYILPYPLWPKLINENFDQENLIVSKLKSISIPWVSSLNINAQSDLEITKLLSSSPKSDHQIENFNLDPQQEFVMNNPGKQTVAALIEGDSSSYFVDRDLSFLSSPDAGFTKTSQSPIQMIVVADSDFIGDQFIQNFPQNINFILNATDYLSLDTDLITIRAKNLNDNPLKVIPEQYYSLIKNLGVLLSPILLILYGLFRHRRRQQLKATLQ